MYTAAKRERGDRRRRRYVELWVDVGDWEKDVMMTITWDRMMTVVVSVIVATGVSARRNRLAGGTGTAA
jgi:hypothetical protein